MQLMPRVLAAVILVSCATALSSQQGPQVPPRDRGNAGIAGLVVAGPDDAPIVGAAVKLCNSGWKCTEVSSDARGQFAFSALPAEVYTLRVEKPGYLRTEFGALRPEGDGTPIVLASNQRIAGLTLEMIRTGSVTGTVRAADGRPAPNVSISLAMVGQSGEAGHARTDDAGIYRLEDVRAGEYLVLAQTVPWKESVPVFHPATVTPEDAAIVRVKNGEERDRIDISLVSARPATVRGIVVEPTGRPAPGAAVSLIPRVGGRMFAGQKSGPSGEFALEVAPGPYRLFAHLSSTPGEARVDDLETLQATADVVVPLEGLSNLTVRLRRGITFSGRVAFDAAKLAPPADLTKVRINLDREGWKPYGVATRADGTFAWSGLPEVFTLSAGVADAPAPAPSPVEGPGWRLRSAMWRGRDLLEAPLDLNDATGDVTGVVLTFTDRTARLSGVVRGEDGTPDAACTVVVFPVTAGPWPAFSPRVGSVRPATDGRYQFRELPAGEYFITTVRDLPPGNWRTSEALAPLAAGATRVILREGDEKSLALKTPRRRPS
jgi:hypothetical protein